MYNTLKKYYDKFGISEDLLILSRKIEKELDDSFRKLDFIKEINQLKVLRAMQESHLSDIHFNWTTGYGYNDIGREKVEEIFARTFSTEEAIVRPNIVNGTHALTLSLQGLLQSGDEMLSISGKPYDTLDKVIGISDHPLSLINIGVSYHQIELTNDGYFDIPAITAYLKKHMVKMVYIQRSKGYSQRRSITIIDIENVCRQIRLVSPKTIIMVDNCYGEFIEYLEPTQVGVDLMAGSLIKNPGGGLALTGGYVVGPQQLIELVAERLTSPGIGKECGLTFGTSRLTLQGLFLSPQVVSSALKGAIFCARLFHEYGYNVFPLWSDPRADIIQAIELNSREDIINFCKGIQRSAPVDSFVSPEPWAMPGYDSEVIMAAGAFIQGSSIELSADAPIKKPYTVYFQGGLTYEHSKLGSLIALENLKNI